MQSLKLYINNTKKYYSPVFNQFVSFRDPNVLENSIVSKNISYKLVNETELVLANNRKLEDLSLSRSGRSNIFMHSKQIKRNLRFFSQVWMF